ncbi:MAG: hypothetical protein ACW990_19980 [Promethearchaeota archaeon]
MMASSSVKFGKFWVLALGGVKSTYSMGAWMPFAMVSATFLEPPVGEKLMTFTALIFNLNYLKWV